MPVFNRGFPAGARENAVRNIVARISSPMELRSAALGFAVIVGLLAVLPWPLPWARRGDAAGVCPLVR